MLVGAISNSMQTRGAGYTGAPKHRIEAYTGRKDLTLKQVEKKRKTGFISGLKSAFSKFGTWVKNLVMPKASKKAKATSFSAKLDRLNTKLEELNDELQSVDREDIRSRFDNIHARLATLETQVGLYDAVADHDLPTATVVSPLEYTGPLHATNVRPAPFEYSVTPTAPPLPSSYSLAGTHEDVSNASKTVSSSLAHQTRDLMSDMNRVAGDPDQAHRTLHRCPATHRA